MHTHSILVFDSSFLHNKDQIIKLCNILHSQLHDSPHKHVILLHGSYMHLHKHIEQLALQALIKPRSYIEHALSTIKKTFFNTIHTLFTDEKQTITSLLESKYNDIFSLLHGICAVKEMSKKTQISLLRITSHIASILIGNVLHHMYPSLSYTISKVSSRNNRSQHYAVRIIPIEHLQYNIDFVAADLAKKHTAQKVAVWHGHMGIQTADPSIIPQAKPIKELDYDTALEISYLGGKLFHPKALYELAQHKVPIDIYSSNTSKPTTSIYSTLQTNKTTCITITHREHFIMLTIRTPNMFNQHGYLEKIFTTCSQHNVCIETLSTSEISVIMTLHQNYLTKNFIVSLKKLGEVIIQKDMSIISLIGTSNWANAANTASILQILGTIPLSTITLGQMGSNLSLITETVYLKKAIRLLHAMLFEKNNSTK